MAHKELWQMEAEKAGGQALAEILTELRDGQRELRDELRDVAHRLEEIKRGFPAGDYEGHRRYHEAVIERMELRNKLVREALTKAVQTGTLIAFGWVAVAMWNYFKMNVNQ